MKRRELLFAAGVLAALTAARAPAQSPTGPRLIAWLLAERPSAPDTPMPMVDAFTLRLKELGYALGRDVKFQFRYSEGIVERLPVLSREVLALKPALILTSTSAAVMALKKETSTVPIVFFTAGDPVGQGLIASLARPGGNVTGVSLRLELGDKVAELVRETVPRAKRIAVLDHESDPISQRLTDGGALTKLGFEVQIVPVKQAKDLDRGFARITNGRVEAVFVPLLAMFAANSSRIAELGRKARVPIFSNSARIASAGGLLSYSIDFLENYRRAASLVAKILAGANPADLPIEQPDRFWLVINMPTARGLGIKIPQTVLLRADRVIE